MVFTGIVKLVCQSSWSSSDNILSIDVDASSPEHTAFWSGAEQGGSICVDGVCLTLLEVPVHKARFFVQKETLACTTLGFRSDGSTATCNLERALLASDRLSGHMVLGHVHGVGEIIRVLKHADGSRDVWVSLPKIGGATTVDHKGSITLDGTSLTIAEVDDATCSIRVSLIPYTLNHTTLHTWSSGRKVNVEFDKHDNKGSSSGTSPHDATRRTLTPVDDGLSTTAAQLDDDAWMSEAIRWGERGRLSAAPNPWVGCVIVNNGQLVGRGYHSRAGGPHAEVVAIVDALCQQYPELSQEEARQLLQDKIPEGDDDDDDRLLMLKGAVAYTTLEPCVGHEGKRTAPCTPLLIRLGLGRVVVALQDPDERVGGHGIAALREAGITVDVGIGAAGATRSLRPYLKQRATGRPHVVVKVATSLDGAVACEDRTSKWITGPLARQHSHSHLRATSDAILVGSGTAVADHPRLTVRLESWQSSLGKQPLRVLLDSTGRVKSGPLLEGDVPTLIYTSVRASKDALRCWEAASNVEVMVLPTVDGRVDVRDVLDDLGGRGVLQVLVEGGPTLQSSFFRARLVDRLAVYVGGCLLGVSAIAWARARLTRSMADLGDAERWVVEETMALGEDVYMEFLPKEQRLYPDEQERLLADARKRVSRAVSHIKAGGLCLVMDDDDRENEGDLIGCAATITPEQVAFMVRHTTGILCAPMEAERARALNLSPMVETNEDEKGTAFTITCDAIGSGTGVSAADRCTTFRALAAPSTTPKDLHRPGHIFPLVARAGGVHARSGHTEAGVALMQLAGVSPPVAVIGEVVKDEGDMARLCDVEAFATQHGDLPVLSLADLRAVIPPPPSATPLSPPTTLPIRRNPGEHLGSWTCRLYEADVSPTQRSHARTTNVVVLMYHDEEQSGPSVVVEDDGGHGVEEVVESQKRWGGSAPLVRVHSECFTGDVFGSARCDCRVQLDAAMRTIVEEGKGMIIYVLGHEGRGIGLAGKLAAYNLMEHNHVHDTYDANEHLGFAREERRFDGVAAVLRALKVTKIRLLSNNPYKVRALEIAGIDVLEKVPLATQVYPEAHDYFLAKRDLGGHDGSAVQLMMMGDGKPSKRAEGAGSRGSDDDGSTNKRRDGGGGGGGGGGGASGDGGKGHEPSKDGPPGKSAPGLRMPRGPKETGHIAGLRITVVRTAWNYKLVDQLERSCVEQLRARGVPESGINVVCVPGAWEIPLAVKRALPRSDAVVAIGVLIKGETMHFEYISESVSRGLMDLQLSSNVPITYGVLNALTESQAVERANPESGLAAGWADSALAMIAE